MAGTNFNAYFTLQNVEDGILSNKVFACYVRNVMMNKPCDMPCERCKAECIDWLKEIYQETPKVELTEFEKAVLKEAYDSSYKYIARDSDGTLWVYEDAPIMECIEWAPYGCSSMNPLFMTSLFQSITWESQTAYKIEDLIK